MLHIVGLNAPPTLEKKPYVLCIVGVSTLGRKPYVPGTVGVSTPTLFRRKKYFHDFCVSRPARVFFQFLL